MQTLEGNTAGLASDQTKALTRLYRRRLTPEEWTNPELTRQLCEISFRIGRQVGVFIDRTGSVTHVIVGDAHKLTLPDIGRARAADGRLRGLRLLHTHLRDEALTRDDLVDLTRLRLDMVIAICLLYNGQPGSVYYAYNTPLSPAERQDPHARPYRQVGPTPYAHVVLDPQALLFGLEQEFAKAAKARSVVAKDGRAILVHVCDHRHAKDASESLAELRELARTAGVEVADEVLQVRERVDPKFVLGRGRLEDVVILAMQLDAEVLIFDRNISPAQSSAIAALTDLKVIDRTQLILDIFAQRAESSDGKLQVEMAQMKYLLPRLGARDDALSRLTGGIGGRGPGETKLEIGRRRANERITRLQKQLDNIGKQRKQRRARRRRHEVPVVAVVGYTNAGKSTLLNALTNSDTLTEDKLFATLDTRSRRIRFPMERELVITDTVGFIRELPDDLFAAFRATFEEAQDADLVLHVVDASNPAYEAHMRSTETLLHKLGLDEIEQWVVFNKMDLCSDELISFLNNQENAVTVSARERSTLQPLLTVLEAKLFDRADAFRAPLAVAGDDLDPVDTWHEHAALDELNDERDEPPSESDDDPGIDDATPGLRHAAHDHHHAGEYDHEGP